MNFIYVAFRNDKKRNLVRVRNPFPHLTLHRLHSVHSDVIHRGSDD